MNDPFLAPTLSRIPCAPPLQYFARLLRATILAPVVVFFVRGVSISRTTMWRYGKTMCIMWILRSTGVPRLKVRTRLLTSRLIFRFHCPARILAFQSSR